MASVDSFCRWDESGVGRWQQEVGDEMLHSGVEGRRRLSTGASRARCGSSVVYLGRGSRKELVDRFHIWVTSHTPE